MGSWTSVVYREYSGARTLEKVIMGLSRWWFFFVFWCNLINPIYGRLFHLMNLCGSSDEVSNASRWGMLSIFWFVTVYHAVIYHLAGDKCLRVQLPSQKTTSNLIDNVNKGIFCRVVQNCQVPERKRLSLPGFKSWEWVRMHFFFCIRLNVCWSTCSGHNQLGHVLHGPDAKCPTTAGHISLS